MKIGKFFIAGLLMLAPSWAFSETAKQWTLKDCIDYALKNNIKIQTGIISVASSKEDVKEANARLFPSLSFSTTHQAGYQPFLDKDNSYSDKGCYSGDYGLNASWTVWDGNKNRNNIKLQELTSRQTKLSLDENVNSIQEQIVQLYVQILYVNEAVDVNAQILDISKQNAARGKEMYEVGSLSKADLAQLEAQVATDEYNLVNIKGELEDYKLQMKNLLRLDYDYVFDIALPASTDEQALSAIPSAKDVLSNALSLRPEIQNAMLGMESSNLNIEIAKAGYKPTVSLSGGIGTNTLTGTGQNWGNQMKSNLSGSVGVTLSIPIFDNRSAKTAVNKAKMSLQQSELEMADAKSNLELTIQGFWINATTNQQRFKSAQVSVSSAEESYGLLSEQFRLGLKNIVELTNAKTVLLNAQQSRLESKYMTILYMQLLNFYKGEEMNLI